ncbi:hypothetical protein EJ05DRAFT_497191 [Pseudovirgaria hyperparasitica]|uniref:Restriction endonuclease type IV Mrr domain-containing protein n=1 Tax=Pseudovirgaria hyperparasitica TaxID=470096 RepID=A0A6A6WJX8_9PEZI|nr:uncharacterized protein EJ05DRAFT_497191 [Pseudovirgaria hyperparasitica]KAF2762337.1 hypothetical protein EJ05DRAFT_497191 [Pseudovirgaria hyperparasitica]
MSDEARDISQRLHERPINDNKAQPTLILDTPKRGRPRKEKNIRSKSPIKTEILDEVSTASATALDEVVQGFDDMRMASEPRFSAGSSHHNDLESFLQYAQRENLGRSTTVFNGTKYEYTVADTLRRYHFDLTRTGRRSDLGIDLIGRWSVPSSAEPLRIFIQCKALNSGLFPSHVRELAGAFTGIPTWFKKDVLGLVASPGNVTNGVRDAIEKSEMPMGFLKISLDGVVEQFHWNRKATGIGLQGMGVSLNYGSSDSSSASGDGGGCVNTKICLTYNGWPIKSLAAKAPMVDTATKAQETKLRPERT